MSKQTEFQFSGFSAKYCHRELRRRTCSDVRRLPAAENVLRLRMRVKQLLGNDSNWLLDRVNERILLRRQRASGIVFSGVN